MAGSYDGSSFDDLNAGMPRDTDSLGTAAAALRQIKRVLLNKDSGGLRDFISTVFTELVQTDESFRYTFKGSFYGVGDIYATRSNSDPNKLFGGVWRLLEGRTIVGAGTIYETTSTASESIVGSGWYVANYANEENKELKLEQDGTSTKLYFESSASPYTGIGLSNTLVAETKGSEVVTFGLSFSSKLTNDVVITLMLSNNSGYLSDDSSSQVIDTITCPAGTTNYTKQVNVGSEKKYQYIKMQIDSITVNNEDGEAGRFELIPEIKFYPSGTEIKSISFTAGQTGGETEHLLTEAELPAHKHTMTIGRDHWNSSGADDGMNSNLAYPNMDYEIKKSGGGDEPHNNMQPYYVVNLWEKMSD